MASKIKKIGQFFFGKKADPLERVEVSSEASRQENRNKADNARNKGGKAREGIAEQVGSLGDIGKAAAGDIGTGSNSPEGARGQLQSQRQLTAALTGAVGDAGSLAGLQQQQAQTAARGQLAAASVDPGSGGLAAGLQAAAQQGLGLAGQAGQAAGAEGIARQAQLAQLTAQQRSADLGQVDLGQELALGGAQNALAGQAQLAGAANTQEQINQAALLEQQRLQLEADLRLRAAEQGRPQRSGALPGLTAGIGSIFGGIFGGPAGAAAGGAAGEGVGTALVAQT